MIPFLAVCPSACRSLVFSPLRDYFRHKTDEAGENILDCGVAVKKRKKNASVALPLSKKHQHQDLEDDDQEEDEAGGGGSTVPQKVAVGSRIAMSSASDLAPYIRVSLTDGVVGSIQDSALIQLFYTGIKSHTGIII